ncbi:hypothetical protein [Croceibacterium ferulae]|uniref:hypothetical protein n=1 Tax=Croceibacterium ferulae TaxID=1854641 RepID=UPI000F883CE7|nr:hypothetical protein [Croceibacterium ferulae]
MAKLSYSAPIWQVGAMQLSPAPERDTAGAHRDTGVACRDAARRQGDTSARHRDTGARRGDTCRLHRDARRRHGVGHPRQGGPFQGGYRATPVTPLPAGAAR